MHKDWTWLSRYVLVIVVALVLGGAIGEFSLFKQSTLGTPKLTASALVSPWDTAAPCCCCGCSGAGRPNSSAQAAAKPRS